MKTIGQRLKAWRKESGLTLVQLSKKISVSQGSLSDQENGISLPSSTTLQKMCLRTDINVHWLLTGQGRMKR